MKLSAPPPPPPPPPEQPPAPGEQPDANNPNANNPSPGTTPAEAAATTPAAETPAPDAAPKSLQWPGWYAGADAALAGLVLVFAFAAASFVARNSDLWLHLAAGKRLFDREYKYTLGSDPFSYSAADRPWVNHSWLVDAVSYQLYGGEGKVLIIAKALLVVLAFGVLLAIRRPKFPLWPWAAVACVAVLAAAPYFILRPQVVSLLLFAVTLYLLFRLPQKPNSWRFPSAIGVTFWLWANSDAWFFIGPLTLALVIVGELIQTKLLKTPDEPAGAADDEPLEHLPDMLTLVKALGVGVLACMLNPHHFRVWELPFELVGAPGVEADPRLRELLYSPLDSLYFSSNALGQNLNGLAYAVLLVAGAAALGFGYGRLRVAHIALWIGFVILSLVSRYTIPFFAVVAVPLVAAQLNAFGARVELKTWGDPRSRVLLSGSSLGRFLCVLGVIALCVMAYPGWVHPEPSNAGYARRMGWSVEPDPALARSAGQFQQWREAGQLPAGTHGVIANTDLANYIAWFAPQEKVFINSRYNHHRRELVDYVAIRKGLGLIVVKDEPPNPADALEILKKSGAEYLAISAGPAEGALRTRAFSLASTLYRDWNSWTPWYLDGRTTVFGWHPAGIASKPAYAGLRVDPVELAFGPRVERVREPELKQPPAPLGWEEAFIRPARPVPAAWEETIGWLLYKEGVKYRMSYRQQTRELMLYPLGVIYPRSLAIPLLGFALQYAEAQGLLRIPPANPDAAADTAALQAAPILALRAARRAIAEDPDHPDPYFALAQVLRDPLLPLTDGERTLGVAIALRQCLVRMPEPGRYKRGQFVTAPTEAALQLAMVYLNPRVGTDRSGNQVLQGFAGMPLDVAPLNGLLGQVVFIDQRGSLKRVLVSDLAGGQLSPNVTPIANTPFLLALDIARDTLKLVIAYAPIDYGSEPAELKERLDQYQMYLKEVNAALIQSNEGYDQSRGRGLPDRVNAARRNGLIGEALRLLSDPDTDLAKEYPNRLPEAALLRIGTELAMGRVENADSLLKDIETPEWLATLEKSGHAGPMRQLKYQKALHAGEYKTAGELWETIGGVGIGSLEQMPPAGPTVPQALVLRIVAAVHRKQTQAEAERTMTMLLVPPLVPMAPLTQPLFRHLWEEEWRFMTQQIRAGIAEQLQSEANYYYRRGVLALLEGDIPTARTRFEQTTRKPPNGWELKDTIHPEAQNYLRLIKAAEKKAAP